MKINEAAKPLLVMLIAILVAGIGTATAVTYIMGNSNTYTVTVTDVSTTINPVLGGTANTVQIGQSITLNVDATVNLANQPINFYDGDVKLTATAVVTDAEGKASFTTTPATIGTHNYRAGP